MTETIENMKNLEVSPFLAINTCPLILFWTNVKLSIKEATSFPSSSFVEICKNDIVFCGELLELVPNPNTEPSFNGDICGVVPNTPPKV